MGDVGAVAELLSRIFGWAVSPSGFALMRLEHQLKIMREGIDIAIDKGDVVRADLLYEQYRRLRRDATN
jgi:hypothetical protein